MIMIEKANDEILWFSRERSTHREHRSKKEVSIAINKTYNREKIVVRFRDGSHKKATSTGYVSFGLDAEKQRLFFLTAPSSEKGLKMVKYSNGENHFFTIASKWAQFFSVLKKNIGNYDLLRDSTRGLYYIDFSKKEVEA